MSDIEVHLEENVSADIRAHVIGGLVRHNDGRAGSSNTSEIVMLAKQEGEIVGGLFGYTNWNWFFIAQLWVSDAVRGQGIGRRLLAAAELEAARRGCRHAHVDTFSFQAQPFYERLGYTIFGRIDDYPPGHTRYFLQKRDLPTDAPR